MEFIFSPQIVNLKTNKIKTLQILSKLGLPFLKANIITPKAFEEYYLHKKITNKLYSEIEKTIKPLLKTGNFVSVRSAVESNTSLSFLPRSESLSSLSDCLFFIKKTWDSLIKNFKNPLEAGISLLLHRFIPSYAAGTIDSSFSDNNQILIEVVYGIWEGIQSGFHDIYFVDKKTDMLIKKVVVKKDRALLPTASGKWEYQKLSPRKKVKQIVSEEQIRELCRQTKLVEKHVGQSRIEFIIKKYRPQASKKAVLLWHIVSLKKDYANSYYKIIPASEDTSENIVCNGKLYEINGLSDIDKLKTFSFPNLIIYLGDKITSKRDLFTIQLVANLAKKNNWPVLYKGGLLTHVNIILREYGVKVFSINQNIGPEEKIKIIKLYN